MKIYSSYILSKVAIIIVQKHTHTFTVFNHELQNYYYYVYQFLVYVLFTLIDFFFENVSKMVGVYFQLSCWSTPDDKMLRKMEQDFEYVQKLERNQVSCSFYVRSNDFGGFIRLINYYSDFTHSHFINIIQNQQNTANIQPTLISNYSFKQLQRFPILRRRFKYMCCILPRLSFVKVITINYE